VSGPCTARRAFEDGLRRDRGAAERAFARVLGRAQLVLGPEVEAFEAELAAELGLDHVVTCANGTDALALALQAVDVGPGDEVIVPVNTCVPTAMAVLAVGATPVPVDVGPDDLLMDPRAAEAAVTGRTRALLPVHLYGGVCEMAALAALAERHGLALVEDCAQAHGARLAGRGAGSFGAAAAFSFYPTKNLGALGDGGAVAVREEKRAERVRILRSYGCGPDGRAVESGRNSRLDELQAAILREKLPSLETDNASRRAVASAYDHAFAGTPVRALRYAEDVEPCRHLYPIRVEDRDRVLARLVRRGLDPAIHYPIPLHRHPVLAERMPARGAFPVAEAAAARLVSLPIGPCMAETDAQTIAEIVLAAVQP